MGEQTPRARGDRLVDALLAWRMTPDRQLEPDLNRFHVLVSGGRRHEDRALYHADWRCPAAFERRPDALVFLDKSTTSSPKPRDTPEPASVGRRGDQ